ncbi:tetratricopeptide repeat protein [Thermodesulfobacteriota bacterium]
MNVRVLSFLLLSVVFIISSCTSRNVGEDKIPIHDKAKFYTNRGISYYFEDNYDQAISDFNRAISLDSNQYKAYDYRGRIYSSQKKFDLAISDFNKALEIYPIREQVYNNLAWLLATCSEEKYRDGLNAVKLAKKAVILGENPAILDTLAAAYAEAGDFKNAIKTQEKAIQLLKEEEDIVSIGEYNLRLESYNNHKPWMEM